MSTQEIADQLVNLCRQGKGREAVANLYADHATSVEIPGWPDEVVNGKEGIYGKHDKFFAGIDELHGMEISEPMVRGNHFVITMDYDATFKGMGRQKMGELCLYEVADGKIVKEQFFYAAPPQG